MFPNIGGDVSVEITKTVQSAQGQVQHKSSNYGEYSGCTPFLDSSFVHLAQIIMLSFLTVINLSQP